MIKAIIFDFDGVIADTEDLHFRAFKEVMSAESIRLDKDEYYSLYLAYDDKTFFSKYYSNNGIKLDGVKLTRLMDSKSGAFDSLIKGNIKIYDGVKDFIETISGQYHLAIGSGALSAEIKQILKSAGLIKYFEIIVAADDVQRCKPDPEVYNKVLSKLNVKSDSAIEASECVVIEDSIYGIRAAKSAGMKCIAVTNSYNKEQLKEADHILDILEGNMLDKLS